VIEKTGLFSFELSQYTFFGIKLIKKINEGTSGVIVGNNKKVRLKSRLKFEIDQSID